MAKKPGKDQPHHETTEPLELTLPAESEAFPSPEALTTTAPAQTKMRYGVQVPAKGKPTG